MAPHVGQTGRAPIAVNVDKGRPVADGRLDQLQDVIVGVDEGELPHLLDRSGALHGEGAALCEGAGPTAPGDDLVDG